MEYKKIIPCMDIKGGRVVKGVNFLDISDIDDPVELAGYYNESGADELVFYDISASVEGRSIFDDLLKRVSERVSVPLIVGGGIGSIEDFETAFTYGASKVSINSGALKNPGLIDEAAKKFGSGRVILSMDVSLVDGQYRVFAQGGTADVGRDAVEWAKEGESRGAGEIVLNSIDADGVRDGFDLPMLRAVAESVNIPIVASGGAGKMEDFLELFKIPGIGTGLAASVFHKKIILIGELKKFLRENGVAVRE